MKLQDVIVSWCIQITRRHRVWLHQNHWKFMGIWVDLLRIRHVQCVSGCIHKRSGIHVRACLTLRHACLLCESVLDLEVCMSPVFEYARPWGMHVSCVSLVCESELDPEACISRVCEYAWPWGMPVSFARVCLTLGHACPLCVSMLDFGMHVSCVSAFLCLSAMKYQVLEHTFAYRLTHWTSLDSCAWHLLSYRNNQEIIVSSQPGEFFLHECCVVVWPSLGLVVVRKDFPSIGQRWCFNEVHCTEMFLTWIAL